MVEDTDEFLVDVPVEVKDPGWNVGPNSRAIEQTVHWTVSLSNGWESVISAPDIGPIRTSVPFGSPCDRSKCLFQVVTYRKRSEYFKVGNNDEYEATIVMCKPDQSKASWMSVYFNLFEWKSSIIGTLILHITDQQQLSLRIHEEVAICKDTHKTGRGWGFENIFQCNPNQPPQLKNSGLFNATPPHPGEFSGGFGGSTGGKDQMNVKVMKVTLTLRLAVNKIPVNVYPMKHHLEELAGHLGSLYESGRFSDVTLMVDGQSLRAHKNVLCARSPVLAAVLHSGLQAEAATDTVEIEDLRVEVVDKMLKFMYTGRVDGLGEVAEDLLTAADKYGLDSVKDLCAGWLAGNLTTLNAAQIFRRADLHSVAGLQKTAADFIKSNMKAVQVTDGWKSLKKSCPQLVIDTFVEI